MKISLNDLIDKPIVEWPAFDMVWDYNYESLRYYADGLSQSEFDKRYPNGLKKAYVKLDELDNHLFRNCKQTVAEFWDVGLKDKKAEVILHCLNDNKITPCKISPYDQTIIIVGGNHRLAVCKAKCLEVIPVLFEQEDEAALSAIIDLHNIQEIKRT